MPKANVTKQQLVFYVFKESGTLVIYRLCKWREVDSYTSKERSENAWQESAKAWMRKHRLLAEKQDVAFIPWHRRDRDRRLTRPQD